MSLKHYHQKRDFQKTSEPYGKIEKTACRMLYVIHKHAARHLHYDLRLELDGVLKSWAVPKGPSLDPHIKRLAIHVEDHPVSYGSFEGVIAEKQYGAGTAMLWDIGKWESTDENPYQAYHAGNMTFKLKGKKLKGLWKLIRNKEDFKNWLFIKMDDKYAKSEADYSITAVKNRSVLTRRLMENISQEIIGKKSKMPEVFLPQLATLVDKPPSGDQWLHEIKLDGYRLIAFIKSNHVRLMTRGNQDWTHRFPHIVNALKKLKLMSAIIDGEIVAIDDTQRSNFQLLQNAIHDNDDSSLVFYVFDLMYYKGYDLTQVALLKRKIRLQKITASADTLYIRYNDHVIGKGEAIFKKACQLELEGIVSKLITDPYLQKRTHSWLKIKCSKRQEFVVGGFTLPQGKRPYFGSLLIGVYSDNNQLQYCGHVGTGFTAQTLKQLNDLLQKYTMSKMPFNKLPPTVKNATWVEPKIIIEVEFSNWTHENVLRHPSFKGLRKDKVSQEIKKEVPEKTRFSYPLSNPDKILYPEQNVTKLELAQYYESIQDWILPYVVKRPLSIVRCPQGRQKKCFYQKHLTDLSVESLYSIEIQEKEATRSYTYIKNVNGLIALVQLGVLEIHPWNCKIDAVEKPDMMIFDLDPAPDVSWKRVVNAAHFIRENLEQIRLISFVKTTGGKGLHIVVPIKRQAGWEEIKNFAHAFVDTLVILRPHDFVSKMTKSIRSGKIFVDYLRNQRGATTIAPYSTRAKENATVSTPLSWDELSTSIKSHSFNIKNIGKRLAQLQSDPWEEFFTLKQKIII